MSFLVQKLKSSLPLPYTKNGDVKLEWIYIKKSTRYAKQKHSI